MKKVASSVLVASALMAAAPIANAEFSANMALTSDYVWRGLTQTDGGPAIQGGIDWAHDSGFYLGTWASNVEFGGGTDTSMEVDFYGGYGTEIADGIGIDGGLIQYHYPNNDSGLDFLEAYVGVSYMWFSAQVSHDWDNSNTYWEVGGDFELPMEIGLGVHYGAYNFDAAGSDYNDWNISVSKSYGKFDFSLMYSDTDGDGLANNSLDKDGRVVLTVGTSF